MNDQGTIKVLWKAEADVYDHGTHESDKHN